MGDCSPKVEARILMIAVLAFYLDKDLEVKGVSF